MNTPAGSPFDLHNDAAWQAWRADKLASLPASIGAMRVHLADPCRPSSRELEKLKTLTRLHNWALFDTDPAKMTDEGCLKNEQPPPLQPARSIPGQAGQVNLS